MTDYKNYSFDSFIQLRNSVDYYRDNPFLQKVIKKYAGTEWEALDEKLKKFSIHASSKWRDLADESAREEVRPYLQHYDAHNHRCDRIIRPSETLQLEKEVFSEGLFSKKTSVWEQITKRFLLHHNGEAGIMCPIACTDGMIDLLEKYVTEEDPNYEALHQILNHIKEGVDKEFGIGAQFVSEIQGGSNVPANILEAEKDGDVYRLYGNKFFCSAAHADYAAVTAKVKGTDDIGVFLVPSWGEEEKEKRNGYEINRLKFKLGTSELPTAEIDYNGAIAYPVGPLNRGVAIIVGVVLTKSRLDIGQASSGFMMRAAREAMMYSRFREVFGKTIHEFPLANSQLKKMENTAKRTTAGNFKVYDMYIRLHNSEALPKDMDELEAKKKGFELRELILMQKILSAKEAVSTVRDAISIFGGHGAIEDFSSIPRIFRDAMVNELWEGPRNVLLSQIFRDILKASKWYDLDEFMSNLLEGVEADTVEMYTKTLKKYLSNPSLLIDSSPENIENASGWGEFCESVFRTYQNQALKEIGEEHSIISEDVLEKLNV